MAWRLANSLVRFRDQLNATFPNRSKASDGTIGDAAHAASASDHNPNVHGVVCAIDITHNPPYLDAHALANHLLANRHPNLRYIISNSRIAGAWTNWQWQAYNGSNPHSRHIHVSVGNPNVGDGKSTSNFDSTQDWNINYKNTTPQGGDMVTDRAQLDRLYQAVLRRNRGAGEGEDVYLGKDSGFVFDDLFKSRERVSRLANDASIAKQAAAVPSLQSIIASRDAQIKDLQAKLATAQAQPPTTGGTFTEADRTALKETNSVVKTIQALLSKIFK